MTGTGCCVKSGDDLKKTRSWDSTPARTVDCVEREKFVSASHVGSEYTIQYVPRLPLPGKSEACTARRVPPSFSLRRPLLQEKCLDRRNRDAETQPG